MKITVLKALEAFQESFFKQDPGLLVELLSDDFVWYSSDGETLSRKDTLEWVANYGARIANFESLYENNEVLVGIHSVTAGGDFGPSTIMFFATLKDYEKIASWKIHRSFL